MEEVSEEQLAKLSAKPGAAGLSEVELLKLASLSRRERRAWLAELRRKAAWARRAASAMKAGLCDGILAGARRRCRQPAGHEGRCDPESYPQDGPAQ